MEPSLNGMSAIQKAELFIADFSANSGYLTVEQFEKFIRIPREASTFMKLVRMQEMNNPTMEIPKISAMTRVLHGSSSAQALTNGQRSKPVVLPKVTLTSKLLRGAVPIPDEVLEDNVERAALQSTVRDLIGQAVARDLEDLLINGDTSSSDDLLSVTDGVLQLVSTNTVAGGGVYLTKSPLRDIDLAMPNAFRLPSAKMKFFTSHKAAIWYRDAISSRIGDVGDTALVSGTGSANQTYSVYNGVPIVPVPMFPENLGSGTNETVVLYCDPQLVIFGVQRQVKFEQERDPGAGSTIIHVTTRVDVQLEHEPMFVQGTGILTS